jgi:predicted AlkP superfamily phosphohydrolase/phosphomutase
VELDKFIKYLYEQFIEGGSEKRFFMILSDHGFAPIKKEVYMNRFLEEKGFLVLKKEGHFYERVANKAKAFNLDPCRIYTHREEVYPRGTVKKEEKTALLEEIKKALRGLKGENGDAVIDQIYDKENIYQGPNTPMAPDLVCLPKDGYDLKGSLEKKEVFGTTIFKGMHTWHDAFCILPENIRFHQKPSVENLTETILQYYSQ